MKTTESTITRRVSEKNASIVEGAGYQRAADSKGNELTKQGEAVYNFGECEVTNFASVKEAVAELGESKALTFLNTSTHVEEKKNYWEKIQSSLGLKSSAKVDNANKLLDKMKAKATEFDDEGNPMINGIVWTVNDFLI